MKTRLRISCPRGLRQGQPGVEPNAGRNGADKASCAAGS